MKLERLSEGPRRGQIVERLRAMIVGGTVKAGSRLTEVELAERLGVSRAPLREAIRELVDSGLLVSVPYTGLFVRDFTRRDLEELYSFRTTLEAFAFRECWDRRTPEACVDLRARNAALTETVERGDDPARAIEQELWLHSWCYELSGHRLLQDAWRRIRPNLQFYFTLHQKAHERPGPRKDAHAIYVACATGDDLDRMLDHIEAHMRQGLERTLGFLADAAKGNDATEATSPKLVSP